MEIISAAQLQKIMPGCPTDRAALFLPWLNKYLPEYHITTQPRIAAFLAQVAVESGQLLYVEEIASGEAYNGRVDLGNTRADAIRIAAEHGSTPGPWWKGHGLIQITGYANHLACGSALGLDLSNNPRLLTLPENAVRSAVWFWDKHDLNDLADYGDFTLITRRINGGLTAEAEREQFYERAKEVLS